MPGFFKRTEVEMKQLIDRLAAEGTPEPQIVELVAEAWGHGIQGSRTGGLGRIPPAGPGAP